MWIQKFKILDNKWLLQKCLLFILTVYQINMQEIISQFQHLLLKDRNNIFKAQLTSRLKQVCISHGNTHQHFRLIMLINTILVMKFSAVCFVFFNYVTGLNLDEGGLLDDSESKIPNLHLFVNGVKGYYIGDVFKGNFFQAEQFCRQHGMNLVSITSDTENNFLQQKIVEQGGGNEGFWTSGTRLPDSKRWIWFTSGKTIVYFNWLQRQPDNVKPEEACISAAINKDKLEWSDNDCLHNFYFICEAMRNPVCSSSTAIGDSDVNQLFGVRSRSVDGGSNRRI